jgi:hypothetical protein
MKRLLFLLVLIACDGNDEPTKLESNVPSQLYSRHITEFYQQTNSRNIDVPTVSPVVRFAEVPNCQGLNYGYSKSYKSGDQYIIEIDNSMNVYENDLNFGAIIFREMSHLLLNKSYASQAHPTCYEIMYPCADPGGYEQHKAAALDCLFN